MVGSSGLQPLLPADKCSLLRVLLRSCSEDIDGVGQRLMVHKRAWCIRIKLWKGVNTAMILPPSPSEHVLHRNYVYPNHEVSTRTCTKRYPRHWIPPILRHKDSDYSVAFVTCSASAACWVSQKFFIDFYGLLLTFMDFYGLPSPSHKNLDFYGIHTKLMIF
jgi:hypothetical protein